MLESAPYLVHTVLTDNGIQFAEQPRIRNTIYTRPMRFDMICEANGIEHRLTKPNHPWTNGQVERMNRTTKDATVKRFHYETHGQLRTHLADFLAAYNFARRLKTLGGLTPYEYICKIWTSEPDRFILDAIHQMPGLNTKPSLPNDEASIRLVGALMLETDDEWAVARRRMGLETLARITDNPYDRLPAVAAWSRPSVSEGRRSYTIPWGASICAGGYTEIR